MPTPKQKQKKTFHFVAFDDATTAPGRKAVNQGARSHAATVTHQRRAEKRGKNIVKWVNKGPGPQSNEIQLIQKGQPPIAHFQISPWSQLSQAKVDPFVTNPHTILPNQLQSILDWAYEMVHPKVLSCSTENEAAKIKISWRRIGQEWPTMFHLQVAAAVNLHRADANLEPLPSDIVVMSQNHHQKGVTRVRKDLNELKGLPSDALIMAQIMVALLSDPDQSAGFDTFRKSPLAEAQNLHRYARLAIVPHLIGALLALVSKRGGINAMKDFGNAQLLQFADLMISSRMGMPPSFPWLVSSPSILQGPRYYPDHHALAKARVVGTGFKSLDLIDVHLSNTLRDAGEITVALDHLQECRLNPPLMTDLVHAANQTHHRLLNIVTAMPSYPARPDFLRDICRIAGLIYSDMVLFPLPPTTAVRPRLTGDLHLAVDRLEHNEGVSPTHSYYGQESGTENLLLIWALMLGGLASLYTPENAYFVQKLQEYTALIPYGRDWRTISDIMGTFLWWDYIFEEPASGLWTEVMTGLEMHHRLSASAESSHLHSSSPSAIPFHPSQRCATAELGSYGLPTPSSSEQSPQSASNVQYEPIWTLPKDAYLVNWVWT